MKLKHKILLTATIGFITLLFIPIRGFYEYTIEGFDLYRVPLIKPFAVTCSAKNGVWVIRTDSLLKFPKVDGTISVDSICVIDHFILLKSHNMFMDRMRYDEIWLVFNCESNIGNTYTTYSDFTNANSCFIQTKFRSPKDVFLEFEKEPSKELIEKILYQICKR